MMGAVSRHRFTLLVLVGVAGLAVGVVGLVTDLAALGLAAGALAMVAAMLGASLVGPHTAARADADLLAAEVRRLREARADEPAASGSVDVTTGLLDSTLLEPLLLQRVAAARRQLHPVSLVLVRIDGIEGFTANDREHALGALGAVLRTTLREADGAFRADDVTVAALLENTSEAGAVWATERLRGLLHSSPASEGITVSAGVACYPSHALDADELILRAAHALDDALVRGRDHVVVAQVD
jgi:diguanylate cyclase (GGDEF)-like protein